MRFALRFCCSFNFLMMALMLFSVAKADAKEPAKFVIVAPKSGVNSELGASLYRVLLGSGQRAKFERVETIEQAVASKADVIVLAMPSVDLPPIAKETLESLKQRKILGLGDGAAKLFGQLGLYINEDRCAGAPLPLSLTIPKSELLGEPKTYETVSVLKETSDAIRVNEDGERLRELSALFLPSSDASGLDVIARMSSNPNYALIVRQGNCVLVGIATPATLWTQSYAELVGKTGMALHQRKLEEFSTIRREVTKSGKYVFQLAPRNTIDKPFVKNFYFQFSKPTKLRAELEHSGSAAIMLLAEHDRQDAFKGETLTTVANITVENIEQIGDRYWVIDVTNFDAEAQVECKLTITIEEL